MRCVYLSVCISEEFSGQISYIINDVKLGKEFRSLSLSLSLYSSHKHTQPIFSFLLTQTK